MSRRRAGVGNAADPRQVQRAGDRDRDREAFRLAIAKRVLSTPEGRAFVADILERAGLERTVFDEHGSRMYFNEGRRNFGLELKAFALEADEQAFELLERERRERVRLEAKSIDAQEVARAAETDTPDEGQP